MLILLTILVPLAGGALLPLFHFGSAKKRGLYTEIIVTATSVLCWVTILRHRGETFKLLTVLDGLEIRLRPDGIGCIYAGLVSVLWPLANLYAIEYMQHEERPNPFFAFYTMTYGITLGVAFSASLFSLYIFFEFMTIITLPLVVHRHDGESSRAGRKYVYYSIFGAALALIAVVFVSHYSSDDLFRAGGVLDPGLMNGAEDVLRWVFLLGFIGFGTKAAIFPMSPWLPSASVAPTPVTALLHAVAVVNTGAFAVIRLIYSAYGTAFLYGTPPHRIALILSCFTIVYGSAMAVKEQHLKRRLAWSTVSNLSYMLMGAALMTENGLIGSMTHLICHSFMKITLFYCAGAIMVRSGCEYVRELRGFSKKMPFTCAIFTVASAALTGVPPLCGFTSKWNLLTAAAQTKSVYGIIAVGALIVSAVLTSIYLLTAAFPMYFRPNGSELADVGEPSWLMRLPMLVFCVMTLLLGVSFGPVMEVLRSAAAGLI